MCGICGLVSPNGRPDRALVDAMRASLVPRGPDEGSTVVLGRCALGDQRLWVLDPEGGRQPVTNETGDVTAIFNGELYTFPELRRELAARGHHVPGTGDTPVIPHLYEELGERFPERLSGMFAIALWDSGRERLVLARDRIGKKPLLWTHLADGTLAFASELKALLRLPGLRRELDLEAIDAYLALQYVPGPTVPLHGIAKLPPGHVLVAERGEVRIEPYWSLQPSEEAAASETEWLERVRAAIERAVALRLVADVPVGVLLSGGIDSSVIVAAAARASSRPLPTFTIGFADQRYDERPYAREVARRFGTAHEEVLFEPDVPDALFRLAEAFDEPLGDEAALPTFMIGEVARRRVTVALTGDGGDEAFAGYERYAAMQLAERLAAVPRPLLALGARGLRRLPHAREPRSAATRAARFVESAALPSRARYGAVMEVFPAALRRRLWTSDALAAIGEPRPAAELLGGPAEASVTELQLLDIRTYLPGDLLLKADIASMAHSLELRSPFLDHEVVRLGLALPDTLKMKGRRGKLALRRAFSPELPPAIVDAPKRGLGVPLANWFRSELRDVSADLLLGDQARGRGLFRPEAVEQLLTEHTSGRAEHGHRLWCLLMLELWQRLHVGAASSARAAATLLPS